MTKAELKKMNEGTAVIETTDNANVVVLTMKISKGKLENLRDALQEDMKTSALSEDLFCAIRNALYNASMSV